MNPNTSTPSTTDRNQAQNSRNPQKTNEPSQIYTSDDQLLQVHKPDSVLKSSYDGCHSAKFRDSPSLQLQFQSQRLLQIEPTPDGLQLSGCFKRAHGSFISTAPWETLSTSKEGSHDTQESLRITAQTIVRYTIQAVCFMILVLALCLLGRAVYWILYVRPYHQAKRYEERMRIDQNRWNTACSRFKAG